MKRNIGQIAILCVLLVILAATLYAVYRSFALPGAGLPETGWLALSFGTFFAVLVGVGLMALLFSSRRRGYDEPPHLIDDHPSEDGHSPR